MKTFFELIFLVLNMDVSLNTFKILGVEKITWGGYPGGITTAI